MKKTIQKGRDFKIIPENFQSATFFEIKDFKDENIQIELLNLNEKELKDYENGEVEVFGSNDDGLIYFETEITSAKGKNIEIKIPKELDTIQRREYSRVRFSGSCKIKGFEDKILSVEDISAGGIKLIAKVPLEVAKPYTAEVYLTNNLTVRCKIQPIRTEEIKYQAMPAYQTSGRFIDIESIDRIALVQYTFKLLMETENKENER